MNETDWRFRVAHREAWIGVGLALFNFVWWFAFAYGLGSRPVEEYTYIFGLPDWFFFSCIVGFLVMAVLVTVIVHFFFVEVPFEEEQEESA